MEPITPYGKKDATKQEQVEEMFNQIAPKYDLLNHSLTFGLDIFWRNIAINKLKAYQPKVIVDIATGTGDFAIAAAKLKPEKIVGIDIAEEMLVQGREKIAQRNMSELIEMVKGNSEALALETESVDAITAGFGVRNFEHLEKGLGEMLRILKSGGAAVILEPSYPTKFPIKQLFYLHFNILTPIIGRIISGDQSAYTYLPDSVRAFPNGKDFVDISHRVGFNKAVYYPLTFGICSLYLLEKP